MASLGDGVGYLSSTSLVLRVVTSTTAGDGPVGKGTWTSQVPNARITENKVILAKDEWKSVTLQYWNCNVAMKYVKIFHMDKLFPPMLWNYHHKVFGVKPNKSTSKHCEHRALKVWFALYPDGPFGSKNKNIISYSLAVMLYVELELTRKVDWRTVLTKNKEDRTEYAERDVHDNFSTF
jgi:hypothetical protein